MRALPAFLIAASLSCSSSAEAAPAPSTLRSGSPAFAAASAEGAAAAAAGGGERYFDMDDEDARIHLKDGKWAADPGFERHPASEASLRGAAAYCAWAGK